MKVSPRCAPCILYRGCMEAKRAGASQQVQFEVMKALLDFLSEEFTPDAVPAVLGTKRDRIVKRLTGNPDPYREAKLESDRRGLEILPLARRLIEGEGTQKGRFRRACLCSIVGNVMEFDVLGHDFGYEGVKAAILDAERNLAIDDIPTLYEVAESAVNVMLLTDNAGEIALDIPLVEELKRLGARVTVAVKGGPALNDATMDDAVLVGVDRVADEVITTGTDTVGLILEECPQEFLDVYHSADLIIAKGMGHLETLTEYKLHAPHAFLLHTKCETVAEYLGVDVKKNVVKVLQ